MRVVTFEGIVKNEWKNVSKESLIETPVFNVRRDHKRRQPPPLSKDFYVIEAVDWVNVIPVTRDGDVVFISLHRHGTDQPSLEIPGGMIDPEDSSPMAAGQRELREETGYTSDPLLPLGVVHPNPAIQDNRCHTFLAPNARLAGEPDPDEGESITVVKYPLAQVPELFRKERVTHSLVIAGFFWFYLGRSAPEKSFVDEL
jgi:8-oxo-dGTP pyrophosphatase MutT (NUDIX family)